MGIIQDGVVHCGSGLGRSVLNDFSDAPPTHGSVKVICGCASAPQMTLTLPWWQAADEGQRT
jgi:hypothetical protein